MDLQLTGKRALVTGSNSGIGRGIATVLGKEGAIVVVHGRNAERSEETAKLIRDAGGVAHIALGNLANGEGAAGCDIALHCSGDMAEMEAVAGAVGPIDEIAKARLDRAMATIAGHKPGASLDEIIARRDALMAVIPA